MQLKKIKILNYKAIKELTEEFDGNIYVVKGDNDKGKTTFGKAFQKLVAKMDKAEKPVTVGEVHGSIEGRFEAPDGKLYTVLLDFTDEKETIRMISPDGISTSKVGEIRNFFNYTNIDVDEFVAWSSTAEGRRKQREIVLNLLPEDVRAKFDELEEKEKKAYDQRTDVNRDHKMHLSIREGKILSEQDKANLQESEAITEQYQKLKEQRENAQKNKGDYDLALVKLGRANEKHTEMIENFKTLKENSEESISTSEQKIQKLKDEIQEHEAWIKVKRERMVEETEIFDKALKLSQTEIDELQQDVDNIPGGDPEAIQNDWEVAKDAFEQLQESEKMEEDFKDSDVKVKGLEKQADDLTKNINTMRNEKKALISSSELPIKGLSVDEEGITINDLPFTKEQLSTSEILTTVFHIMTALNKTTPIFYLGRVESLGKAKLDDIVEVAKKEGYQLFLDTVESGEELTIEMYEDLK